MSQTSITSPARAFAAAKDAASELRNRVEIAREGEGSPEQREFLKPAEELICYYEVAPGEVSLEELETCSEELSALGWLAE